MTTTFIEELEAFKLEIADYNSTAKEEALTQWAKEHTEQYQQELRQAFPVKDLFKSPGQSANVVEVNATIKALGNLLTLVSPFKDKSVNVSFYIFEDHYKEATTQDIVNLGMWALFGCITVLKPTHYMPFSLKEWSLTGLEINKVWNKSEFPFIGT